MRLRIMLAGIAVAIAACSPFSVQARDIGRDIIGRWRISSVLDGTNIASMDEKQARGLIGHIFTIGEDGSLFEKYTCGRPNFETERVQPNLYLKRTDPYVSANALALPNPVTVIDIGCTTVFIKNKDRLVIFWGGFYFDAVRQ